MCTQKSGFLIGVQTFLETFVFELFTWIRNVALFLHGEHFPESKDKLYLLQEHSALENIKCIEENKCKLLHPRTYFSGCERGGEGTRFVFKACAANLQPMIVLVCYCGFIFPSHAFQCSTSVPHLFELPPAYASHISTILSMGKLKFRKGGKRGG